MYTPYADKEYYVNEYHGNTITTESLNKALKKASRHIDTLTYNRIVGSGYEKLTSYQQDIVSECVCELADFYEENEGMIENVLKNYSINGVTMEFGATWNVNVSQGIAIKQETLKKLQSTGLCSTRIGR